MQYRYRIMAITSNNMQGYNDWIPHTNNHWKLIIDENEYSRPDLNSIFARKQIIADASHCWFVVEPIE